MDYVLDYFWCSNSKNLHVPMFHSMLYGIFYPISSMLLIVHVKSIYNVNKSLSTVCMIIVDFFSIFLCYKPQNRSHRFYLISV
jgi:hypothetical protein